MPDEKKPENAKDRIKESVTGAIDSFKKNEKVQEIQSYAKEHKADTAAYIILFIGLLVSLFSPLYGGAIIGAIVGIYFADEVMFILGDLKGFVERKGKLKSLILLALLIAFFIVLPSLFIVAAAAVGIKQLVAPTKRK